MGYELEEEGVVIIDIPRKQIKGYTKAKDFKRQIAELKEELCPESS